MREKNITIPASLFQDLVVYSVVHADLTDERYKRIQAGINRKAEADRRRELYSRYKSNRDEDARREYLAAAGIPESYRY